MKFGVNSRTNIPYPAYHRGRKANGEYLIGNPVASFLKGAVETKNLNRFCKITIDT